MLSHKRNCIVDKQEKWEFRRVEDFTVFDKFDCEDTDLNDFIKNDAAIHKEELIAETYAFSFTEYKIPPIAFVSLSNDSIRLTTGKQRKLIPNIVRKYSDYPAVKIGRLAVDKGFKGQRVGTKILDVIKKLFTTENRTGCKFLTVDAYISARYFYEKNEFKIFPSEDSGQNEHTMIMYYDLKNFIHE